MPTEVIRIQVTAQGADAAAKAIENIGDAASKADRQIKPLPQDINAVGGAASKTRPAVDGLGQAIDKAGTSGQGADTKLKPLPRTIDGIDRTAKQASGSVGSLGGLLAKIGAVVGIARVASGFTSLLNESINLENRLRAVTDSSEQLDRVYDNLFETANDTRQAFGSVVQIYARVSASAKELGRSEEEVLRFTRALSQEVKLSGASATEASNALIQLAQGLGSGTLRGDELRSVLEQLPTVADRIAESLGVTRGQLRQLGADGKITANDVIKAFLDAEDSIANRFAKAVASPADAFVVLQNRLLDFVRGVNQASGVGNLLAQSILGIAESLNVVLPLLAGIAALVVFNLLASQATAFVAVLTTGVIPALTRMITVLRSLLAVSALTTGAGAIGLGGAGLAGIGAVGALSGTLPVILGVAAAAAAIYGTYRLIVAIFGDGNEELKQTEDIADRVGVNLDQAGGSADNLAKGISAAADSAIKLNEELDRLERARDLFNENGNLLREAKEGSEAINKLREAFRQQADQLDGIQTLPETVVRPAFRLTEAEQSGVQPSEIDKTSAAIRVLEQRIVALNNAHRDGSLSAEDHAKAVAVDAAGIEELRDKIDQASGGLRRQIEELEGRVRFFRQAGGDLQAADLLAGGADVEAVGRLTDLKNQLDLLTQSERDRTRAMEDSRRAEEQRVNAIDRTLDSLRQQRAEIGQTAAAVERLRFQQLQPSPEQLKEFDQLRAGNVEAQTQANAQEAANQLVQAVAEFKVQSDLLRQAASGASAEVQAQAEAKIQEGLNEIKLAANRLGEDFAAKLGEGAGPLIEQTKQRMSEAGGEIGRVAGDLLGTSFFNAMARGIGALASLIPGAPAIGAALGVGGGAPAGAAGGGGILPPPPDNLVSSGAPDSNAQAQQFADFSNRIRGITEDLRNLRGGVDQIGGAAQQSFGAASSAAQGFGNSTVNIGQQINNVFQNAFSGLENALVSFVTTGKLDFKQLINSILADLARMVVQMLIIRPLLGFFGGIFGGFLGFNSGGIVPGFRSGGFVPGPDIRGYATGGVISAFGSSRGDTIPAMLSGGEFVVNSAATARNRPYLEAINSGANITRSSGGGRGAVTVVNAPVITVNSSGGSGGSKGSDADQGRQIASLVQASLIEFVAKEKRPGGALYTGSVK
jgi:tape measure domain-containing protein